MKSNFDILLENFGKDVFVNVVHIPSGEEGVASATSDKKSVRVFSGNPDGSDDKIISIEEFNKEYMITKIIVDA